MAEHAKCDVHEPENRSWRRTAAVVAACVLCLLAIALVLQTISFSVRSTKANNVVTFGSISIQTIETSKGPDGQEVAVPSIDQMSESAPASRIVCVKNVGKEPAYVRVKLALRAQDPQGTEVDASSLKATYTFEDPQWVEKDGWYYFKKPLAQDEMTGALITAVQFDVRAAQELTNNGLVHLDIVTQGVQVKNNAESVFDAEGWPEEADR